MFMGIHMWLRCLAYSTVVLDAECAEQLRQSTPDSWYWLLILTRGNYFSSPNFSNMLKTSRHTLSGQLNPFADKISSFDQSHERSHLKDKVIVNKFSNACSWKPCSFSHKQFWPAACRTFSLPTNIASHSALHSKISIISSFRSFPYFLFCE